ncbi:MFS transporter [Amycolatopsis anabasis]|uniref:MFS transporter n=1 Tax=Amycolatopsis anabasis TaxID=1840409 RepID=UPI00131E65F0|nr:MFS transporter [Amycolatopsis anabasis]
MTGLLAERAFARLWLAAFFSETAEWMLQVALPVFVFQHTGSATSTAASMVLGLLPAVALSPIAGVLADRWDRRVLLCAVCAGQAVVALPLLLADGLPLVYLVMAAQAGLASLFEPARSALVPELVGVERVTAANGLLSVNNSVARLIGSALGGLLLGFGGLAPVLAAYLGALLVAAALLAPRFAAAAARPVAARRTLVREWLDGLAEIRRNRALRIAGVVLALTSLAQGMFLVLFVLFVLEALGGSEADVGLLRGVQAVGGLAAGLALATVARRVPPARLLGWATAVMGLLSALIWNTAYLTTAVGVFAGLFAVVGAPGVMVGAGQLALVQTVTDPRRSGRVLSTAFAGMAMCQAVGMLLAGLLAGPIGLAALLDVQAALLVAAGAIVLVTLAGRPRIAVAATMR